MSNAITPPPKRKLRWLGANVLTLSIVAHILFGVAATYFIVETIQARRVSNFTAANTNPNPAMRAVEHKVQLQKKQQTMSAPAPTKRITTTSNVKVALPAIPVLPNLDQPVLPVAMAGMGGTSLGMSAPGTASGNNTGSGGGAPALFGLRQDAGGDSLVGTFYDLKQTRGGQPTPMIGANDITVDLHNPKEEVANGNDVKAILAYVKSGFSDGLLGLYFQAPSPLYAKHIFVPTIEADEAPKSFNLADKVKPRRWAIVYKANVTAPESGKYQFVGAADDFLIVRFDKRVVLDGSIPNPTGRQAKTYEMDGMGYSTRFAKIGDTLDIQAGTTYPLEVLIGELPGGEFRAILLLQKEGVEFQKDSKGSPILPLFKVAKGDPVSGTGLPTLAPDFSWSVWKATKFSNE